MDSWLQSGPGDVGARAGGRTGRARRGIHASPHHPTLVAMRDHIKSRRLSAASGSGTAGYSIRRRSCGVLPRVVTHVATSVGHAANLAPVERPVGVEV